MIVANGPADARDNAAPLLKEILRLANSFNMEVFACLPVNYSIDSDVMQSNDGAFSYPLLLCLFVYICYSVHAEI